MAGLETPNSGLGQLPPYLLETLPRQSHAARYVSSAMAVGGRMGALWAAGALGMTPDALLGRQSAAPGEKWRSRRDSKIGGGCIPPTSTHGGLNNWEI